MRILRKVFIRVPMELRHLVRAFGVLAANDMLVVAGTGLLTDAYGGPLGWPYGVFKWSLVAKLCRCKLFYVSVGAGPLYRPLSRWFIKSALSLADFRSYRDNSTRKYLEDIGFARRHDAVYPDLAFNLPEVVMRPESSCKSRRPVVGVGLMRYTGELSLGAPSDALYGRYLAGLAVFVKWLLAREYDVRLLIGDVLFDEAAKQDLRGLLREDARVFRDGRIIDEPVFSVQDLLSQLAASDIVVATRFHNVLLALVVGRPVISLSFHHKSASLMCEMGLSEYSHDIHDLDVNRLTEQFCDLEENADRVRAVIKRKAEEFRRALDEQYAVIFE